MVAIDFSTHRPEKGYKMLLETGQTGPPRLQAASLWIPGLLCPPLSGRPAGYVQTEDRELSVWNE